MIPRVDSLRADIVFAWRQIKKRKIPSAAAVLSLALAIGACTSAFRLIDALFLRPLPISEPQRLYALSRRAGSPTDSWEHLRFRRMREAMAGQADLIAASMPEQTDLTYASGTEMEKAWLQYVSGWMFRSFGLRPAAGRLLTEDDDRDPGGNPVAVLSYDYWTRRFGRDSKVVGSTVQIARKYGIGSQLFEIVGVASEAFTGTEPGTQTEIFLPATIHPLANLPVASLFRIFVRLPAGVPPEPVRAHLDAAVHALDQQGRFPFSHNETLLMEPAASGLSGMQKYYGQALAALGTLAALVLLIACANLANLMSAQAAARAREMALRASIGAGRAQLVRLVLVECAILSIAAAALGAILAWPAAPFVVARINPPENPARLSLAADWRVLGFALALTFAVTLLFGLPPALRAPGVAPASALRGGDDPRRRGRMMRFLIAVQASFCSLVLFISGLFVVTFARLAHQDMGFPVDGLLALYAVTPQDEPPHAWNQVAEHLRSVPGVESAAVSEWPLLDGNGYRYYRVSVNGGSPSADLVRFLIVSPGWIETMKIPLVEGRDLRAEETDAAIVNREFAREYFPGTDAIGKWFEAPQTGGRGRRFQIVGLAGDTRYKTVRDPIMPVAFIPYTAPWHVETFMVRLLSSGSGSPAISSALRQEVARAKPGFRVTAVRTQQALLQAQTVRERLIAMLGSFFAVVALLLAGIGLYGVLDYSVFRRRREIAIRMAIGAQSGEIARRVTLETFFMLLLGGLAGLAMGLASARYLGTLLYQVSPTAPAVIAFPSLTILAMALLASAAPVVRALRTDPAVILRAE